MRKLVFVALAGLALAGCNGGGTATNGGAVSADSVTAAATDEVAEAAKWDTIDWDAKTMPIYVDVDNKYGGKFIPCTNDDSASVTATAATYKTFSSAKGKFAMKYEGYDKGAGAGFGTSVSNRWATGFKYDVSGAVNKNKERDRVCGMGFNEEFLKSHEVLEFKGYDTWQEDYWDKVRKDVPETVKQRIKAKYPNRKLEDCMCGGKSKDGKVQVYSAQMDKGAKALGLRVVIEGDSMYVMEQPAEEDGSWRVDDDGHYNNLKVLAITRGKDGLDLFYDDSAPESTCIGVVVLRGGQMFDKRLFDYYNDVDFVPQTMAVDLGLSVKWASQNMGAKGEEDAGTRYSWGRTEYQFKDYIDESSPAFGKIEEMKAGNSEILDAKSNLNAKYDVATDRLGKGWRMPTKDELAELMNKCDMEMMKIEENWVCKFKAKNGNFICLPLNEDETTGSYWSSIFDNEEGKPYAFTFDKTASCVIDGTKYYYDPTVNSMHKIGDGYYVRAVYDGK